MLMKCAGKPCQTYDFTVARSNGDGPEPWHGDNRDYGLWVRGNDGPEGGASFAYKAIAGPHGWIQGVYTLELPVEQYTAFCENSDRH